MLIYVTRSGKMSLSRTLANDYWENRVEMNIFLFSLFQYNCVVFSKSAQIVFFNFKCHFHKIVTHATELCDIYQFKGNFV